MAVEKQIAIQVRPKNNRLLSERRRRGLTVVALAKAAGVPYKDAINLENLQPDIRSGRRRQSLTRKLDGSPRRSAELIALFLEIPFEDLFPAELDEVRGGVREIKADIEEFKILASQLQATGGYLGSQPVDPEMALLAKEALYLGHKVLRPNVLKTVVLREVAGATFIETHAALHRPWFKESGVARHQRAGLATLRKALEKERP